MLKTKEEIADWLNKNSRPEVFIFDDVGETLIATENWTINEDLTVDVVGDVKIYYNPPEGRLPIKFRDVSGNFDCSNCGLISLGGAPVAVKGHFNCSNNKLSTLEGAPIAIGGSFNCTDNCLRSLKGSPREIPGRFTCQRNELTSLHGAPRHVGSVFSCSENRLTSLEGSPETVAGRFWCDDNPLNELGAIDLHLEFDMVCPLIPELDSISNIYDEDDANFQVSAKNFNAKVNELKRIREEKALLESQLAKLVEPYDREKEGPLPSEKATKPKMKHKI